MKKERNREKEKERTEKRGEGNRGAMAEQSADTCLVPYTPCAPINTML
jgi:hypothetical protein